MKNSKLKRRIWITAVALLIAYVSVLVVAPNIWVALLPIIVPATVLTIGIPGYSVIRTSKEALEKETNKQVVKGNNTKNNQQLKTKDKIVEDKQINNVQVNDFFEPQYETDITQERNKVKTKGTIH